MKTTLKEFAERNMPKHCDIVYTRGCEAHYIDGDKIIGGCLENGHTYEFWEGDFLDCAEYDHVMRLHRFE